MPHTRAPLQRKPRTLMPLIVVVGPALSALALTVLGYVMFRQQAAAHIASGDATAMLSGPLEYTIILALAGALISLLMTMLGLTLYGRERKWTEAREHALAEGVGRIAEIERIARRVAERGERREAAASAWARRQREAFAQMNSMMGPRAALQRVVGDIWAGVSHPGAPLDAPTALKMARESAVAGAALGAALDDLRALMAASPAEIDAIEAIDDALVDDLMALEDAARQTRHALVWAVGERATIRGAAASERADEATAPHNASTATRGRPVVSPGERAPAVRAHPSAATPIPPYPIFPPYPIPNGERPRAKDGGLAWPPPVDGKPVGGQDSSASNGKPAGSSGQGPRPQRDADIPRGEDSSARWREPRDRDDSGSRWLND